MEYLAHRGCWTVPESKNTFAALTGAIGKDFGLETDIRDFSVDLVISHDPPKPPSLKLNDLFQIYQTSGSRKHLALNIKSDGIGEALCFLITTSGISNYFCFDMSIPETIKYRKLGLRYFVRESEFEIIDTQNELYQNASGVWMDQFIGDWIQPKSIRSHTNLGKKVALVSPELHGRNPDSFWSMLRKEKLQNEPLLMLCTDFPEKATAFFEN